MKVPFVDLHAQYLSIKQEIDSAIEKVIRETAFISGSYAASFEKEFAVYTGVKHCMACANGTDSLEILLKAMGIGSGDEVIVPALSWISTSESVSSIGATPVFVDVDDNLLIDLNLVEAKINARTKAIIPVHLYGNPVDMDRLMEIANKHGLKVMEDCAQSHGAKVRGKQVGSFGHCASYSFYPGKNLGAYGDAGAMTTSDDRIAEISRAISNHGQQGKHNHIMEGRNSRMDGMQGAILSAKLPYLAAWTEARIKNAQRYNSLFNHPDLKLPSVPDYAQHVFHLYVIRIKRRQELMEFLKVNGIETSVHYPIPLPLMPCYKKFGYAPSDFPVAAQAASEILSLPMYPELSDEQAQYVVSKIEEFLSA
ncbi:MAG: DegT/DnrJ/EryC1/StrS family aminotransferase [Flavobacteriales bacterium]